MNADDYHAFSDTDVPFTKQHRCSQTLPKQYSNLQKKFRSNHTHEMKCADSVETADLNTYFEHELQLLLIRKDQLESRIHQLQQSREELTSQLDNLSHIPRYSPYLQQPFSLHDPLSLSSLHMNSYRLKSKITSFRSYSTPSTPIHHQLKDHCTISHFTLF